MSGAAVPWWLVVFRPVWRQADVLESRLGHELALQRIEERIARSKRKVRKKLYVLHDEIVRREISNPAF